jgi:hypothetical protein
VFGTGSGPAVIATAVHGVVGLLRGTVTFLMWMGTASLVAIGSWYCGYAAREAWTGLSRRRQESQAGREPGPLDPDDEPAVQEEVERGLRELEEYLTSSANHPSRRGHRARGHRGKSSPCPDGRDPGHC